ncbi:MAG: hypothetical protein ACR2HQ_02300 [Ilumatobacteraceae bacterium]
MTAGEAFLIVGGVLCGLAFAALAITLLRVFDALRSLRREVADVRTETGLLLEELRASSADARDVIDEARLDLARFDRVLGSAEAISGAVGRSNRVARTTLSVPMIKAAGLATGTSRAVRRLRRGA